MHEKEHVMCPKINADKLQRVCVLTQIELNERERDKTWIWQTMPTSQTLV